MNPTHINTAATTPTTTGSKLIKNEYRYIPVIPTTIDGVCKISTSGSVTNAFPVAATTAIVSTSSSLVHVIPLQLPATATSSTIGGATVKLAASNASTNLMPPPLNLLAIPTATDGNAGKQVQTHVIPLDKTQFINQTSTATMPLSMPTSQSMNMYYSGNTASTSHPVKLDVSSATSSTSIIHNQGTSTNVGNVSSTVPIASSNQSPAATTATFVIPKSKTLTATVSNVLPTYNLNHDMVKKIVIGANTANGTSTKEAAPSPVCNQLPKQHQLQLHLLTQQKHNQLQNLNATDIKPQKLLNTVTNSPKVSTSTSATAQQQKSSQMPQLTSYTSQEAEVTPPPLVPLVATKQLENSVAQEANKIGSTQTTNNKKQHISNQNYSSGASNVNVVPSDKISAITTNVATLETKSSLLIKNKKDLIGGTLAHISSNFNKPSVIKSIAAESMAKVNSENSTTSTLLKLKTFKTEEKKLPATEQKQESLLKTKTTQCIVKERTSPRAKRSKSLNNATADNLARTEIIVGATERRFSSPDSKHKAELGQHCSSSSGNSPQKREERTFVLIDDDDDADINQELAGFDEEYLDGTSTEDKSSDASDYEVKIVSNSVKKVLNKNDIALTIPSLVENETEKDNIEKSLANTDFANKVNLEDNETNISLDKLEALILNEPSEKCKEEIVEDKGTVIKEDTSKENHERQHNPNEPLDKSLFCEEQLLVSSSSTSASSTSSASMKNISTNEPIKMNISTIAKSSTSFTTSTSISPLPSVAGNSAFIGFDPKSVDINSYSTVLGMLSTFNMLSWKERIGTARGTSLRFQLNEFNLLQVHERCQPRYKIHTAYEKPIYERESYTTENTDPLLYLCRRCNCHGPAGDFLAPEFCSLECLKRDSRKRQRDIVSTMRKRPRKDTITTGSTAAQFSNATTSSIQTAAPSTNYSNNSSSLLVRRSVFRWSTYLNGKFGEIAAPVNLFLNPFPTGPNNFQIGMKLEAIDPENCSLFCVCTVVDIQGYRLNLNFDGYDRMYNFWVNADSMDIFPPGWCAKTNRILQPPKGLDASRFNWPSYFAKEQAIPAPRQLFTHLNSSSLSTRNPFKIGMHLEAEDLNDTGKLCVATVADVLNERIRIHFDGWDDCYDYWVDTNSPYIHPCGWFEGRHQLVVPPDYENGEFCWSDYIKEHRSNLIAPVEIFAARDPIDFKPRMKLEVVDPRNPMLIRPATIIARRGHRVKIHLDQWPTDYCFWLEDDSPDLHPIGWCDATRHDLEAPPGYQSRTVIMPCSIAGCRGIGNAKVFNLCMHSASDACPYAPENWNKKIEKPPRIDGNEIERKTTAKANVEQTTLSKRESQIRNEALRVKQKQVPTSILTTNNNKATVADDIIERLRVLDNIKTRRSQQEKLQQSHTPAPAEGLALQGKALEKLLEIKQELDATIDVDRNAQKFEEQESTKTGSTLLMDVDAPALKIAKEYLCDYGPRLQQNYNIWQQNLSFNCNDIKKNPLHWTTAETCLFIEKLLNLKTARTFAIQDIDGAALLALHQSDLTDILDLKLGPAVKLYGHILQLRTFYVKTENAALKNSI